MRFATQLFAACLALFVSQAALAATADELKALLDKGDARGAYEAGRKSPEQFGQAAFDFYFGVAAIDSGHAGEGVLALERYVINHPGNREARLELARGYFVIGEYTRAREEFNDVLRSNPPPAVVANIERFLDAIRAREAAYQTTVGAFIEVGAGYDTNINGGVSGANITLPNFGVVTLVPTGVRRDSFFGQVTAGANITHPVRPGLALVGSFAGDYKFHERRNDFDIANATASGGLTYLKNKHLFRGLISYNTLGVDYDRFRETYAASGEWIYQLDEFQQISTSGFYSELEYVGDNRIRDSKLFGVGLGYRRSVLMPWSPLITFSGTYAHEDNKRARQELSRDIWGARVAVAVTPAPRWALAVGATAQHSHYESAEPLFGMVRADFYYAGDISLSYAITRALSVRAEALFSRNDSNLALFDYSRNVYAIKLRYDFK